MHMYCSIDVQAKPYTGFLFRGCLRLEAKDLEVTVLGGGGDPWVDTLFEIWKKSIFMLKVNSFSL